MSTYPSVISNRAYLEVSKSYKNDWDQAFSIRLRVYECGILSLYCDGYCNDIAVSTKFNGPWSTALKIRRAVADRIKQNPDTSEVEVQDLIDEMVCA